MRQVRSFHTHLPCLSALPPATSHPGLPPATRSDAFAQRVTGDRNGCCGHDSFQVTGTATVVSLSGVSPSAFSLRHPGASSRWPNGRFLNSPMPVPVTRHLNRCSFLVNRASGPPGLLCVPLAHVPTCPPRPLVALRQVLVQRSNCTA